MLDIAIVGAGPTGSRVAFRLAQMGCSVTVLDRKSSAGQKICCTGIISQECVGKYKIPQSVVYRHISSARLFSPSGDFIKIHKTSAQASVVNRSAFDIYLSELAIGQGARYFFNTVVEHVEKQADKVILSCKTKESVSKLEARVVILACGFNSILVKNSGFGQCRYLTTGVQSQVKFRDIEDVEIYFGNHIAPGFFAWLVPTFENNGFAGLMSPKAAGFYLKKWLNTLEISNRIVTQSHSICYAGIPMYPLEKTYSDRLLVVGDAAGQVKPTTGGGIYFGLLSADIAAETIYRSLEENKLSASDLSVYQEKWHKALRSELRSEYFARRIYQRLSDARVEKIFAIGKSGKWLDANLSNNNLSFDWHGKVIFRLVWAGLFSMIIRNLLAIPGLMKGKFFKTN